VQCRKGKEEEGGGVQAVYRPKEGRYRVITILNIPKKESKEGLKQHSVR
jgi:hypothetical protein